MPPKTTAPQPVAGSTLPAVIKYPAATPLHVALRSETWDGSKSGLIDEESAQVLCPMTWQMPIHLAAQYGHLEAVKLLVEVGADVDCKTQGVRAV